MYLSLQYQNASAKQYLRAYLCVCVCVVVVGGGNRKGEKETENVCVYQYYVIENDVAVQLQRVYFSKSLFPPLIFGQFFFCMTRVLAEKNGHREVVELLDTPDQEAEKEK